MSTNDPMTQEQLDAIQEREAKATAGPWSHWSGWDQWDHSVMSYELDDAPTVANVIPELDDAVFIAHARTDIPALLAEVERLRALTTVTEDMVERGVRAFYGDPTPGVDVSLRPSWDRFAAVFPGLEDSYRRHMTAALNAAFGTGGPA